MIVPGRYGMKSVQWLTEIEVVDQDYKGYYAQKGWTDEAIVKTTSRIDRPGHGSTMKGLRHKVEGLAFAGTRGIKQVEISTDGGESWRPAILDSPVSPFSWVFWRYDWRVPQAGHIPCSFARPMEPASSKLPLNRMRRRTAPQACTKSP
jgi:DMSO/TMAO reductase YedYZ molybdopterin-dependent catalytic subunit